MTRKNRRNQGRRGIAWPVLAFGGVLLLTAVFLFARGSGGGGDAGGTPKIAADPQKIDYGYVKFGNDETFTIKVTNTGTGALRFNEQPYVEVLEGC